MAAPNRCMTSVLIFIIVITGILAVSSLVIGFVIALHSPESSKNGNPNSGPVSTGGDTDLGVDLMAPVDGSDDALGHVSETNYADRRIWMIHVGEFNHRIAYLDDVTEQVKGLDADMVNAVCRVSRKRCRLVFDDYSNCYNSDEQVGLGLKNNYYHACAGWAVTYLRTRGLVYGEPWYQASRTVWVTLPGNPANFNPRDLNGRRIGFVRAWTSTVDCVNRLQSTQGLPLDERDISQVALYDTVDLLIEELQLGQIDAGFIAVALYDPSIMEQIGEKLRDCVVGDVGMVARPTSQGLEFIKWWNEGMMKLRSSGEYRKVCSRLETVHGHKNGDSIQDTCLTQYL